MPDKPHAGKPGALQDAAYVAVALTHWVALVVIDAARGLLSRPKNKPSSKPILR